MHLDRQIRGKLLKQDSGGLQHKGLEVLLMLFPLHGKGVFLLSRQSLPFIKNGNMGSGFSQLKKSTVALFPGCLLINLNKQIGE